MKKLMKNAFIAWSHVAALTLLLICAQIVLLAVTTPLEERALVAVEKTPASKEAWESADKFRTTSCVSAPPSPAMEEHGYAAALRCTVVYRSAAHYVVALFATASFPWNAAQEAGWALGLFVSYEEASQGSPQASAFLAFVLAMLPFAWFSARRIDWTRERANATKLLRQAPVCLLAPFVMMALAGVIVSLSGMPFADMRLTSLGLTSFAVVVLVGPFMEECIFRGWAWRKLSETMSTAFVVLLTSLAFAAIHLPSDVGTWLLLIASGLGLGWLRHRSGSVLAAFTGHALSNALALSIWRVS